MTIAGPDDLDAVLLDAGGVLMLPDPAAFRRRLERFGVAPDDAACEHAHYRGMAEIDRLGRTDYEAADRLIATLLGVAGEHLDAAAEAVNDVYTRDRFVAIDGVTDALHRLSAAGLRLGVVSNANGKVEAELLQHRICSLDGEDCATVEVVIDSYVVGIEKPDPAIFALALDALGLAPERCLYVGDSAHFDVSGATAAGLEAVHVTPLGECRHGEHAHAASLGEFVDRLFEGQPGEPGGPSAHLRGGEGGAPVPSKNSSSA